MMYGKHFSSMYEGSLYGSGVSVFAVWGYVIAAAKKSRVELNPRKLADTLGGTVAEIESAIEFLMKPDASSRHKAQDGRRLIKEGEFQYFIPSWETYQRIRNEDERREYNRVKQAETRAKVKSGKVRRGKGPSTREQLAMKAHQNGDAETAEAITDGSVPPGAPLRSERDEHDYGEG